MTERRDPAVAPNPSSASTQERAPAEALLASEEFESTEAPTIVEAQKAPEIAPHTRTRPLLGPALWIGGTTLWSYGVAGQFVLRASMPEVLGIAFVVGVLVSTAYLACGRSLELSPARGEEARKARYVKATWVGVAFAAAVVLLASLVGTADAPTMLFLFVSSLAGVLFGKRLTGRPLEPLRGARRALSAGLWVVAVGLSLMVLMSTVN